MKLTRGNKKGYNRNRSTGWVEDNFNLHGLFDDFITRDFLRPSFGTTGVSTPAVNIIETNDDFILEMVAPGMCKEDFSVELEEDVLTICYDHEDNRDSERRNLMYLTREHNYHSFIRSFALSEEVEAENIQAKYEAGILSIIIPKREDAKSKRVRQIAIS